MRFSPALSRAVSVIMVTAAFTFPTPAWGAGSEFETAAPEGFEDLASERRIVLDAYFGGEKLGEVLATTSPGILTFDDPAAVAKLIPGVLSSEEVANALTGELPANSALACGPDRQDGCGTLHPPRAGIILDADQFRVEIFLNPTLLANVTGPSPIYLASPDELPSLVSLVGATVSGSNGGVDAYHLQNRSIASFGAVRLRSDSSLATRSGLSFDSLMLEADRPGWRYTGGIFWAPGTDLIGRRKIAGLALSTQTDTRLDKETLLGTPLTLFLQQPARVEVIVDGKLASSRIYSAGHNLVDTTSLPNGSYDVVLRIREDGRPPREERRFFTKGSLMAPPDQPLFSLVAGLLQPASSGLSVDDDTFFYEASAAYRLSESLGLDATVLGTQHKAIFESGVVLATSIAQVRIGALASSSGDFGAMIRASTVTHGPLALSFDLRKVISDDGGPLIPVTASQITFSDDHQVGFADRGSYTQGLAILDYRFGPGTLRLTGTYRRNGSEKATYSIGSSLEVPVVRSSQWDIRFQADARQSDAGFSSFIGMRFLMNGAAVGLSGIFGVSHDTDRSGRSGRIISETQAAWHHQFSQDMQISTDAAIGRDADSSYARGSGYFRSSLINARGDLLQRFGGDGSSTQYALNVDGGLAAAAGGAGIGARETNDTAAIIRVSGGRPGQEFDVLVDDVVRGTVSSGRKLTLFLAPYEAYGIRLRPNGAAISSFDTGTRTATLYPGNVVSLEWQITPLVILFGRAIDLEGEPITLAEVAGEHGIGRTDEQGYFQIEVNRSDTIQLTQASGDSCILALPKAQAINGYISAGEVLCQ